MNDPIKPSSNYTLIRLLQECAAKITFAMRIVLMVGVVCAYAVIRSHFAEKDVQGVIQIEGNETTLEYGNFGRKATIEPENKYSMLVNTAFYSTTSDAMWNAMSMDDARQLKEKYKDFVHCNSPGVEEAKRRFYHIFLFAADPHVRRSLKTIGRGDPNTVVDMTASKLNVTKQTINSKSIIDYYDEPKEYYLVSDVQVMQGNYE